jgi:hypothetical protein
MLENVFDFREFFLTFSTTRHRAKGQWKTEAAPEPCPESGFEGVVYPKRLRASV